MDDPAAEEAGRVLGQLIGICFLNATRFTRELCDDVDPMPDYENVLTN